MAETEVQIAEDNETRLGHYSDLILISHRKEEFILDVLFIEPRIHKTAEGQVMLTSLPILNRGHRKRLYQSIGKNFGKIVLLVART